MNKKKELLNILKDVTILYRSSIDLSPNDLFGIEIEYQGAKKEDIDEYIITRTDKYKSIEEKAIYDGLTGGEVVSPILRDEEDTWNNLSNLLNDLKNLGCYAGRAGGHIHFDTSLVPYDLDVYYDLLKLWCIFENEIYQFSYGEKDSIRNSYSKYAYPIKSEIYLKRKVIECLLRTLKKYQKNIDNDEIFETFIDSFKIAASSSRLTSLSIEHVRSAQSDDYNTIEVRTPNGTLEKEIWQNNINFFAKFLKYFKSEYDKEYIDYQFKQIRYEKHDLNNYDIDKALILKDMIFKDEIDKLYFLKQYTRGLKIDTL